MSSEVVKNVTVYDRVTKQSRVILFGPARAEAWWQEGDGSCDCNRCFEFWRAELESEELSHKDVEVPGDLCVAERYVVTHFNGKPVSFSEWNADYKDDESLSKESVAILEKMLAHIIENRSPLVRPVAPCGKHASEFSPEDKLIMEIGSDISLVEIGLLSFGCNGGWPTDPVEMVKVNVALLQNVQRNLMLLSEAIEKRDKEPKL